MTVSEDGAADTGGARLVHPESDEWPKAAFAVLRARGTEPRGLWVLGDASLAELTRRAAAVVGTHEESRYGSHVATMLAYDLASDGVTVVSCAAFGVDECAQRVALRAGGRAIAVVANGVDMLRPEVLASQFEATVAGGGLIVSEHAPTAPPRRRNRDHLRIVAALASATILVEARKDDPALELARAASGFGRRVFVVPGPITSPKSDGPNELLRAGEAMAMTHFGQITIPPGHERPAVPKVTRETQPASLRHHEGFHDE